MPLGVCANVCTFPPELGMVEWKTHGKMVERCGKMWKAIAAEMPTALLMYGSTTAEASRYSQQSFDLEIYTGVLDSRVCFQCCMYQGTSPNSLFFSFAASALETNLFHCLTGHSIQCLGTMCQRHSPGCEFHVPFLPDGWT